MDLDELFESDVGSTAAADSKRNAALVRKDNYRKLVALGNVNSYSMQQDFFACPRRYQIKKLRAAAEPEFLSQNNLDFCFGHAVGAGVATYDQTRDVKKAILSTILAWNLDLFEQAPEWKSRDPKKEFHHAIWAVKCYASFFESELTFLHDLEWFRNEASVAVDFENGQFYVAHIDTLFRGLFSSGARSSGQGDSGVPTFIVKENKTTSFGTINPALYSNSEQGLSYSVPLAALGAVDYDVLYTIYSTTEQQWLHFIFPKTPLSRAEWVQGQFFVQEDIQRYSEHGSGKGFFPKRGSSCLQFGRECEFYGQCDISPNRIYGMQFSDLEKAENMEDLDKIEPYEFKIKISDVIAELKRKTSGDPV